MAAAVAAAGCSGEANSVATLPPEPNGPPPPAATEAASTTQQPTTTQPTTTSIAPSATVPVTGASSDSSEPPTPATVTRPTIVPSGAVGLSADGPWKLVDSAPGVTSPGLVYELMPKLWVFLPTEESTDDGTLFVPSPNDIPIIEAYLRAELVYFRSVTSNPINLSDPGWQKFFGDKGESYMAVLGPRRDAGQVVDLDLGVVLQPRVIGDGRTDTSAIVFDCGLDGGVFRMPDGALAPGSTPGVVRSGTAAPVDFDGTDWIVRYVVNQIEACQ
jgi:hypothetical protein